MLNPYDAQTLDPHFKKAVDSLPVPYNGNNLAHRREFAKFIATYGTHYTSKVVLGAKRILTTTMTSQSVAELTRDSVDIASTLSVKMQVSPPFNSIFDVFILRVFLFLIYCYTDH